MSPNELIDLFVKYKLITSDEKGRLKALKLLHEDEEPEINALELLAVYVYKNSININVGDCAPECVIEEFIGNFQQIKKISKGKVKAQNLSVTPELGTPIENDKKIEIKFDWDSKNYRFSFSKVDPSNFIDGFAKWLCEAFNGDFLFIRGDLLFGYLIPKELIKELEAIGIENNAY